MSAFDTCTRTASSRPLDAAKRVNYRFGLVLGADEFWQQDAYTREAEWLATRALLGYGTIAGLKVEVTPPPTDDPVVSVSAGLAVNPRGQFIPVPAAQCASLNTWLGRLENRRRIVAARSSPPVPPSPPAPTAAPVKLYLVLSYEECETDPTVVPGGPCRSQEDAVAASRIADHFTLSFELQSPAQSEDLLVRQFGRVLGSVQLVTAGPTASPEAAIGSRITSLSPFAADSGTAIKVRQVDIDNVLRRALHDWIVEMRPDYLTCTKDASTGPSSESGVLIAEVNFSLTPDWKVKAGSLGIDDTMRPLLVHTRALQEWLMKTTG